MVTKLLSHPLRLALAAAAAVLCLAAGVGVALAGHGGARTGAAAKSSTPATALFGDAADPQPAAPASVTDSSSPSPAATVPTPAASPKVSALVTSRPATLHPSPSVPGTSPSATGPASVVPNAATTSATATGCPANQQLTDPEINWLLGEVSSTAGTDPQYAAGKATIDSGLQPLIGQNLCANQAQPTVNTLCADPSASTLIAAMTKKMPAYVRVYVGNPCSAQLSTVLPKLAPFAAALG